MPSGEISNAQNCLMTGAFHLQSFAFVAAFNLKTSARPPHFTCQKNQLSLTVAVVEGLRCRQVKPDEQEEGQEKE